MVLRIERPQEEGEDCKVEVYIGIQEAQEGIKQFLKDEKDGSKNKVRDFNILALKMFKDKDWSFVLFYSGNNDTQKRNAFKEFCRKIHYKCYETEEMSNRSKRYSFHFLKKTPGVDTVVALDNTSYGFPPRKYVITDFSSAKDLVNFNEAVFKSKWPRHVVCQNEPTGKDKYRTKNIIAATRDSYKSEIQHFDGDVIVLYYNSDIKQQGEVLAFLYKVAFEFETLISVRFIIVDSFLNDVEEYDNQESPALFLYDFEDKQRSTLKFYNTVDMTVSKLRSVLPVLGRDRLSDL